MRDIAYTRVDGLEVAYRACGQGPALVLLHAFPLDHRMWGGQLTGLAEVAHVITPDLPGFGRSQATDGHLSIDQLADWVHAFARVLGHERFVLGGLSMGGYVALSCALRHGLGLRGLVLADTRAGADSEDARERRFLQAAHIRANGLAQLAADMPGHLLAPAAAAGLGHQRRQVSEWISQARPATVCGALQALADRPDQTASLSTIDLPTLVVVGEADSITPAAEAEAMAARLPQARVARIPGAGHLSAYEAPEAFNRAVTQFLQSLAP